MGESDENLDMLIAKIKNLGFFEDNVFNNDGNSITQSDFIHKLIFTLLETFEPDIENDTKYGIKDGIHIVDSDNNTYILNQIWEKSQGLRAGYVASEESSGDDSKDKIRSVIQAYVDKIKTINSDHKILNQHRLFDKITAIREFNKDYVNKNATNINTYFFDEMKSMKILLKQYIDTLYIGINFDDKYSDDKYSDGYGDKKKNLIAYASIKKIHVYRFEDFLKAIGFYEDEDLFEDRGKIINILSPLYLASIEGIMKLKNLEETINTTAGFNGNLINAVEYYEAFYKGISNKLRKQNEDDISVFLKLNDRYWKSHNQKLYQRRFDIRLLKGHAGICTRMILGYSQSEEENPNYTI